jgi:hypothetical protein
MRPEEEETHGLEDDIRRLEQWEKRGLEKEIDRLRREVNGQQGVIVFLTAVILIILAY